MKKTPIRYQTMLFCNTDDISPTPEIMQKFIQLFHDEGFLPTPFPEINPLTMEQKNRLGLRSPNNDWLIDFPSDRIVIQKSKIKIDGPEIGTIEEFTSKAQKFFTKILKEFPRKGNRLSLISSQITDSIPEEEMQKMFHKLNNAPTFYQKHRIVEWKSNAVVRIPIKILKADDELNVISSLIWLQDTRIIGMMSPFFADYSKYVDRILIDLDINTFQGRTETRFGSDAIKDFYKHSTKVCKTVSDEWIESINV